MAKRKSADRIPGAKKEIVLRAVKRLLLDPANPRLALEAGASQEAILRKMYRDEALEELATSFSRNGYFWEEPLVAAPSPSPLKVS